MWWREHPEVERDVVVLRLVNFALLGARLAAPGRALDALMEAVASRGTGLLEGPRWSADGSVYFSDVIAGGVYRAAPDGSIETVVEKRRGVGGLVLHEDGGVVCSGRDLIHVRDGETRTLLAPGRRDRLQRPAHRRRGPRAGRRRCATARSPARTRCPARSGA